MKLRASLLCLALLAFAAAPAFAQYPIDVPGQLYLAWDNCLGGGGLPTRNVDCQNPTGSDPLYASLLCGVDLPGILADIGVVDVTAGLDPSTLPAYWGFHAGGCSGPANLLFSADFSGGPFNCYDLWAGLASTGGQFAGQATPVPVGNRARIKWTSALLPENPMLLPGGPLVYIERVTFRHGGLSACPGCQEPVCLVYNEEQLTDVTGRVFRINNPGYATANASPTAINCPGSTPNQARTWGQMKALYR